MPAPRYSEVARAGVREAARAPGRDERGATNAARTPAGRVARGAAQPLAQTPAQPTAGARFVFPFAQAVNKKVMVQLKNGCEYEGILHAPALGTEELHIALSNARKVKNGRGENGAVPGKAIPSLVIPGQDFAQLKVSEVPGDYKTAVASMNGAHKNIEAESIENAIDDHENGAAERGFEGDRDRAKNKQLFDRDLVQWDGGDGSEDGCILEDSLGQQNFDQFTGKKSTFKWETYTSRIDPEKSKYTRAEADKIASEIEADETRDIEDDTDSTPQRISQDDKRAYSSTRSQLTEASRQITPPKKFSWVDAVRGKPSGPVIPKDVSGPHVQKTVSLNKQPGAQWGQNSPPPEPTTEDHAHMKIMSLSSSMAAKEKKIVQNSSGNDKLSTASLAHSNATIKGSRNDVPNGVGPVYPIPKKPAMCPKSRESLGFEEMVAKENMLETSRPAVASKTSDLQSSNFDSVGGTQPSKRPSEWGESGSDNCFFDKPSTAPINKRGNIPSRAKASTKKQEAAPVHRTPIAVPLKGAVSHGNPWKTRVVSGSGNTDDSPVRNNSVDSTSYPARSAKETVPPIQTYSTPDSDPRVGNDHAAADTSMAGASQKVKNQPSKQELAEAQQLDAEAVVDAVLKQTIISSGKPPARPTSLSLGSTNTVQKGALSTQVIAAKPVPSSRVQPGISWSQKVKESLVRDSARMQVSQQATTSAKKPSSATTLVPQNSATYKLDEAGDPASVLSRKQGSDERGKPKAFNALSEGLDRPRHSEADALPRSKKDAVNRYNSTSTSDSTIAEGVKRSATAGTSSEVGKTISPHVHTKSHEGFSSDSHKNNASTLAGGSGMNRKRAQQDTREKQLNPNAPPYKPPLYAPYPYGVYDHAHVVFMNEMAMGMNSMPPHRVFCQPHRPPPTGKGRGVELPPSNPGYYQPVVGPGFMPKVRAEPVAGAPAGPMSSPVLENGSSPSPCQGQNGAQLQEAQPKHPKASPHNDLNSDPLGKKGPADGKEKDAPDGSDSPCRGDSSVVTPWPSFPGAGVWHSDQRPMHNAQTPMMTGYGFMVGPFPVWPGMPPYVPAHGQPDAAMWARGGMHPMHLPEGAHPGMPGMVGMPHMPMMWRGNFISGHHHQQVKHRSGRFGNNGHGRGRSRHNGKDSRKSHRPSVDPGSSNHATAARQED